LERLGPGWAWVLMVACASASAHGFGARYDLPLPLSLWIVGAAATVVLSFLFVAVFIRWAPRSGATTELDLLRWRVGRIVGGKASRRIARVFTAAAVIVIILAGLIGNQTPTRNLAPTAIWIAWWVGFSYVSAFIGDVWCVVNPWAASFELYENSLPERSGLRKARNGWPGSLGVWPATGLFVAFAWIELIWDGRAIPSHLAWLAVAYSLITWAGMYWFGKDAWLKYGDPFVQAFGILAKFAPTETRVARGADQPDRACCDQYYRAAESERRWILRLPGAGLLVQATPPSVVVFVIVMLSTVTFDGLMATPLWQRIENLLYGALPSPGNSRLTLINTAGLLFFCAAVLSIYRLVSALVAKASPTPMTAEAASQKFVLTLVPIAIAYLIAHYLSYFLIQGQLLIRLVSDPFGFGWNIFGSARFRPDIGIVGARFVWYTSLVAIVLGHVIAICLAHVVALRNVCDKRGATRCQIPMLILMVGYTMMSLWIIAQPIVE
jgi:hypothetical protein